LLILAGALLTTSSHAADLEFALHVMLAIVAAYAIFLNALTIFLVRKSPQWLEA